MKPKKTWRQKLTEAKGLPKVSKVDRKLSRQWGEGKMVIPAPVEVDALMKRVPKGRLITVNDLRAALAIRHKADFACPLTTGIFAWIAAHAAEEASAEGVRRITPYWRTLKNGGELNPKYPGGTQEATGGGPQDRSERQALCGLKLRRFIVPKPLRRLRGSKGVRGRRFTVSRHISASPVPDVRWIQQVGIEYDSDRGCGRGDGCGSTCRRSNNRSESGGRSRR